MFIFITIALIICFILHFSWKITAIITFDSSQKTGALRLKIFGLKIFGGEVELNLEKRLLELRLKKKKKVLKLSADLLDKDSLVYMAKNADMTLLGHIDINYLFLDLRIGSDNAMKATMLTQLMRIIYAAAVSVLKSRQIIETDENISANYEEDKIYFDFTGIISMSLIELIGSFAEMIFKKMKTALRRSYDY